MISIYKKYNAAYYGICFIIIIIMVIVLLKLHVPFKLYPLVTLIAIIPVIFNAIVFTKLADKKLSDEVLVLFNNCHLNEYINSLNILFANKNGITNTIYSALVAKGYACLDDYDAVFECCKNIKARNYKAEYHLFMLEYYIKKEHPELAQRAIDEVRKLMVNMKNVKYKESCELRIKNVEYAMRIQNGDYEGAEEHYTEMLNTITPMYQITKVSYSYALGKLLYLKNETERAKKYLQYAYEYGGDTKYRFFAEDILRKL